MMRKFFICLAGCILLACGEGFGKGLVTIQGQDTSYAGRELTIRTFQDQITSEELTLAQAVVAADGSFSLSFEADETRMVFFHLGRIVLYLYAEPGHLYVISLPPWQEKTQADRLNPYFEEISLPAIINNIPETDLNIQIRMFDDTYDSYLQKFSLNPNSKINPAAIDTAVISLLKPFENQLSGFFRTYVTYKLAILRQMGYQFKSRSTSEKYFLNEPVLYINPAYMELFNLVYDKYFMYFMRTETGRKITSDITEKKSLFELKKTLATDQVLGNDTLLELVILKNLHDEYYSDRFSRSALLVVLDSLIQTTRIAQHRIIGTTILHKLTRLQPGYLPPDFSLADRDNRVVKLSDLRGRYVYLCFCACNSYSCLKEFEMLQKIYDKHRAYLEIVMITVDPEYRQMVDFLSKNKYNWLFLHYGMQPEILKEYDIRGYPTYFLLGRDGKLILSPAPSPYENFEVRLFEIMRNRGDI
jgi:peroxiredoxin